MSYSEIKNELFSLSDPQKKEFLPYYFKTNAGQYGEGDQFIGVVVPLQRQLVKKHKTLPFPDIEQLVKDPFHECRMTGLLFLVEMFNKTKDEQLRKKIYDFYLAHADYVNNWDLVDLTAKDIVGGYLWDKSREALFQFATTDHLWLQRISIIATHYFIKKRDFDTTFQIAELLLNHPHDLIHKAVGWMLREVGNRDYDRLYHFITENQRYEKMPRTMLRYTIEKFPEDIRKKFLKGEI